METESYAIVSDQLDHNKEAVCTFLDKLLADLRTKQEIIDKVNILTDGAASQFKNKYIFAFLEAKLRHSYNID